MKNLVQHLFFGAAREMWTGNERRSEPREDADCQVEMKVLDRRLPDAQSIQSRLVSVSANGMQLRVGFIVPNQPVQIQLKDRTVDGRVRYCISAGDHFQVGIHLR